jgi:hypothetical protein
VRRPLFAIEQPIDGVAFDDHTLAQFAGGVLQQRVDRCDRRSGLLDEFVSGAAVGLRHWRWFFLVADSTLKVQCTKEKQKRADLLCGDELPKAIKVVGTELLQN